MNSSRWFSAILFGLIFSFDRVSKSWAVAHALQPINLSSWLTLIVAHNTGIAWSIGSTLERTAFGILLSGILVATTACVYLFAKALRYNHHAAPALSMITAGALSNLYDRCIYGAVIDFILVHYGPYSWPVFNGADIAICIGALIWWFRVVQPCH